MMTDREAVIAVVRRHEVRPVPYTVAFEESVGRRLDEWYGGPEWRGRLKRYIVGVSAVDTNKQEKIDETHVRDAYGGIWRVDQRPWHLERPPLPERSLAGYQFPRPEVFFRPDWKEQAFRTCRENQDKFLIAHLGWGLFERSWNLRGFENVLMDAIEAPQFLEDVLDGLTELYLAFLEYTLDLPVDAVMFGDDWGDQRGVILGPERWRRFLKPRWARLYEAVHAAGKIVIHHSCGSIADIMEDVIEIGMDVHESVQPEAAGMNPYELKEKWGDRITFWGCLGSQSTIPFGTPEDIRREVRRLKREMGRQGGFILAPAKPLQPETPTENAVAVVEAFLEEEDE